MSEYQLRAASIEDAPVVQQLLALAGAELSRQGFRNWDPPFSIEQVKNEIAGRDVFLVSSATALVATYSIGLSAVRAYPPDFWPSHDSTALYMNRLAVDPAQQGKGIGGWCLSTIRQQAVDLRASFIRCDVLAENTGLCRFYEKHGFLRRGEREHSAGVLLVISARHESYEFESDSLKFIPRSAR